MINDIDEAIVRMEQTVAEMDRRRDRRAVFLYAYLLITYNMRRAIRDDWFFDGAWLSRLAGKFARLYFESLEAYDAGRPLPEAWKLTHDRVLRDRASVVENLLLGINAHINYDLAFGIVENILEHGDQASEETLLRRKFDHDRVNEVLAVSTDQIQREIPRRYGGMIPILDIILGRFDEFIALAGIKSYRENVWSNVRYLLLSAASGSSAERAKVVSKIHDEAVRTARTIIETASPFDFRRANTGKNERDGEIGALFSDSRGNSSEFFNFEEAISVAVRAAVPELARNCVVDLVDADGVPFYSVSYPNEPELQNSEAADRDSRQEPYPDQNLDPKYEPSTIEVSPLASTGAIFGTLTFVRDDVAPRKYETDADVFEEYARHAVAEIEYGAAGQALRAECRRLREKRAE